MQGCSPAHLIFAPLPQHLLQQMLWGRAYKRSAANASVSDCCRQMSWRRACRSALSLRAATGQLLLMQGRGVLKSCSCVLGSLLCRVCLLSLLLLLLAWHAERLTAAIAADAHHAVAAAAAAPPVVHPGWQVASLCTARRPASAAGVAVAALAAAAAPLRSFFVAAAAGGASGLHS